MFIIIRIPIHTTKNSIFQLNLQLLLIWTKRDWNKAISLPLSSCFSKLTSQDITFLLLQIQFYFFVVVIEPSWRLKLALKPYVQSAAEYSECVCGRTTSSASARYLLLRKTAEVGRCFRSFRARLPGFPSSLHPLVKGSYTLGKNTRILGLHNSNRARVVQVYFE